MDHSGHGMMMDLPPFTLGRGLQWSADPFFLIACTAGLVLYVWGVVRLKRRGDFWKIAVFDYRLTFQAPYEGGWAKSPDHPIMITPWEGTFPAVPNGPDELRPIPPQWPHAVFQPFHYLHPITGRPIGEGIGRGKDD